MEVIQAFKDPSSGRIFESLAEYAAFVAERQTAEDATASAEARRARLPKVMAHVIDNLEVPQELERLITELYRQFVEIANEDAARRRKKFKRFTLKMVQVSRIRFTTDFKQNQSTRYLSCEVVVAFSREVGYLDAPDDMQSFSPSDIIAGFELQGGGSGRTYDDGNYALNYGIRCPVSRMPKLAARIERLTKVAEAARTHELEVEVARQEAIARDVALKGLRQIEGDAHRALLAAQVAHDNANFACEERRGVLIRQVSEQMPFPEAAELAAAREGFLDLEESSGFLYWR